MKNAAPQLPYQYIKVSSRRFIPRILLHGEWLAQLGFEINSQVRIKAVPHQILLTSCHQDADVELMLGGTLSSEDPENALIESQRFEAYSWLCIQSARCEKLAVFLSERENSFVLSSTIFDLIHTLMKAGLLQESA